MINVEAICITSDYEGMSNVALEAACVGTKAIIAYVNPNLFYMEKLCSVGDRC